MENTFLSYEEQIELVKLSVSGDEKATVDLINLCYPIAGKIAKRYMLSSVDKQDLMQEAAWGVLYAIPRYRAEKGVKFTTYATWWIKKRIRTYAETNFIRRPEATLTELKEYSYFLKEFLVENGREPTDEEVAQALDISVEKVQNLHELPTSHLVLDEVTKLLPSGDDDVADAAVMHVMLEEALGVLKEDEKQVIIQHWGLFFHKKLTQTEIARELDCSQEWVRQLENSAIQKMKDYFKQTQFTLS